MDNLGVFIRNERLKKDISLRKLARDTNINASYISHLENGNIKSPSLEHILKIFNVLEVDPNYLIKFGYKEGELDPDFIERELNRRSQKGELQKLIRKEINNLDRDGLEAAYLMLTKRKELMMNVYRIEERNERLPITLINDLMRFFQSEYASKYK